MNEHDEAFMRMAVNEAAKCVAEPGGARPRVGAVVARDAELLCTAFRGELKAGDHAEFTALEGKLASTSVAGATVYTTLEPCTTRNSPKLPCAERLIQRKVARVVIGTLDPNPNISGRGLRRLREANIVTELFPAPLMAELEELNREFISHFPSAGAAPRAAEAAALASRAAPEHRSGPLVFVGKGQEATSLFSIPSGLVVFKLSHDGSKNFVVWILNAKGERVELLTNSVGPFAGSKAVRIPDDGPFLLDIQADGPWLVSVVGSGPSQPISPAELPRLIGGAVQNSRNVFIYHLTNHGAAIYDVTLSAAPGVPASLTRTPVLETGAHFQITVDGAAPGQPLTVSLRYSTASGHEGIQMIELPQSSSPAKAVP